MQGTIAVLMALSGLGCHHKSCDVAYAPACYSACYGGCYDGGYGGCYGGSVGYVAPACYNVAYYDACYGGAVLDGCYGGGFSGCYSGCYGGGFGGCYGGGHGGGHGHKHGLFSGLFGCHKANNCCQPVMPGACYSSCYSVGYGEAYGCYSSSMPVYGSYTPVYGAGQAPIANGPVMSPQFYDTPIYTPGTLSPQAGGVGSSPQYGAPAMQQGVDAGSPPPVPSSDDATSPLNDTTTPPTGGDNEQPVPVPNPTGLDNSPITAPAPSA